MGLRDDHTCLTHIFIDFIHETQMLMVFLSPERGLQVAQQRIPYILKQLSIYYDHLNGSPPREEFLDELDKFIYHAICFNYQKNIVLERDKKLLLEKAYRLQVITSIRGYLINCRELYADMLGRLGNISPAEKQSAQTQLEAHRSQILPTFQRNTCEKPAAIEDIRAHTITRIFFISLFLFAVYLYFHNWEMLSLPLGLLSGTMSMMSLSIVARRRFTPEQEKIYTADALKNLAALEHTSGFKEEAAKIKIQFTTAQTALQQKKGHAIARTKEVLLNNKLNALLEANRLSLIHSFGLKKLQKNSAPSEQSVDSEKNPPVVKLENVEDTRIVCCTFPENDNLNADAYDVRSLNQCYRPRRQRNLISQKKVLQDSPTKMAEVLYPLPAELQHSACLVLEGSSKMIFDLSIYFGDLSPENQAKFLEGQFRVVAQTGQFNGFKALKSGGYELKLPSSNVTPNKVTRFFFEQQSHKEVKTPGETYKVPYYRATGTGGK